jgi:hypothetical protein
MKKLSNYKWQIIGAFAGGLVGYFYWKEIGCSTGTCIIQSNWQSMVPYGIFTGYLIADFIKTGLKRFVS